jgi:serine/threonine-protein kinase OSR1/STK39
MEGACERRMYPLTAADYKLMEEIGNGLSATVYRAVCLPFKEVVAVKALDLERCNSNLEDIRREAVTMTLINHPNVLRAYCSFVVEQRLWVVMPFMAGGSCLQIMKSNFIDGFEEGVIATLLKETLKALEYLHRQGHIHRDVKAGNILVDGNGSVKLADFGVSACMFDTGDRQRTRKTFVGTPCWMAPEVMEQLHGYDFKADIWSFGITALELAHGHAPFSRYPPMKVLLMTLQNAPPGLDYERDKRFSKSFKEMIAMCLVKEPSKRPTAEKLLRHSFFKHARTPEYIFRHILEGLPPLGDRLRNLQNAEGARLAQQNLNFDEQEERSQTEYKRGVSAWNFDVEALKAQSALIPDDDDNSPKMAKEDTSSADSSPQPGNRTYACSPDKAQLSAAMQSMNVETSNGNGGCLTASRNCPSSKPSIRCMGISGRKEPKHIGRFDVFEDDNILESPGWHGSPKHEQRRGEERDQRKERDESESRRGGSGPLVPEKVVSGVRGRDEDHDREHRHGRVGDRGSFSGPLLPTGERPLSDHRPANGVPRATNGSKEGSEKGPAQKAPVLQKGRFSVTSDDGDFEGIPHVSSRRNLCSQGAQYQPPLPSSFSSNHLNGVSVPAAPMVPHLQNALQLAIMQQETIMQLLNGISPIDAANSRSMLKRSSFVNHGSELSMAETQSDREMEYLQQIAELKSKLHQMLDERECLKKRNVSLERQLNAIYNKEEEERIRREEAAKEDG